MKIIHTSCQVCRRSLQIEVASPSLFSDEVMREVAVCDDCEADHNEQERNRIAKFHKAIEREERHVKQPYKD